MIDWDKPIETVDGCKADLIQTNTTEPGIWHMVHVLGGPGRYGDVFLVNDEGYRCDDRAIYSKRQEPFIRNALVKREGWVHVRRGTSLLGDYRIFSTETDARKAASFSEQVVRMEWEEYP